MSRRQKRTTRTVTFSGGPRDGQVQQAPVGTDGVVEPASNPWAFHRYTGPAGAGAVTFTYQGIVDPDGNTTTEEAAAAAFQESMHDLMATAAESSGEVEAALQIEAEERARATFRASNS